MDEYNHCFDAHLGGKLKTSASQVDALPEVESDPSEPATPLTPVRERVYAEFIADEDNFQEEKLLDNLFIGNSFKIKRNGNCFQSSHND